MGNYEQLKQAVSDVVKTNGNQEITGAILQNALLSIISTVGSSATFAGIAIPTTNPGTPDQNLFYIATTPGQYSNFDGINIECGEVCVITNKTGSWIKQEIGIYGNMFHHFIGQLQLVQDENIIFEIGEKTISISGRAFLLPFRNSSLISFNGVTIDFTGKEDGFNAAYIEFPYNIFVAKKALYLSSEDVKYLKYDKNEGNTYPLNSIILATYSNGKLNSSFFSNYIIEKLSESVNENNQKVDNLINEIGQITSEVDELKGDLSYLLVTNTEDIQNDFEYGKYWGVVDGKAGYVTYASENWNCYKSLIPVNEGDIIRIFNVNQHLHMVGYYGYDNDEIPTVGRVNINQQNVKRGYNEFIIPANCTLIGLSFRLNSGETPESANVYAKKIISYTISEQLNNEISNIVEEKIPEINKEGDLSASYYQKGAAPKEFEKKICLLAAGQSNIDGRVPYSEMPDEIKSSQPISNCQYVKNSESGAFSALNITGNWAFDLVTYYNLAVTENKEIYVIKWSEGGTSIDPEGATKSHWSANYEEVERNGGISLLRKFENEIRNHIKTNGNEFDVRALLWHQGEGDGQNTAVSLRYYENLKYMIAYIRGIVGNETLPIITGTISHLSKQYNVNVENAQKKIADEDPNFYLIDMSGAPLLDSYHFNKESSVYFGEMAFNALIDAGVIIAEKLNPIKPW